MDLFDAASYFDDVEVTEVGTTNTWLGQLDLFDDSKRDGLSPVRRILSTSPEIPSLVGKVVTTQNKTYIVGLSNEDQWLGDVIRTKYVLQQAQPYLAGSILQFLQGADPMVYLGRVWVKDQEDEKENSNPNSQYQFIHAKNGSPNIELIFDGVSYYFTIGKRMNTTEMIGVFTEEVGENAQRTVEAFKRTYDLVTDKHTPVTLGLKSAIRVRYKLHYSHISAAFKKWEEGDQIYFLERSLVPTLDVDDTILDGQTRYRIIGKSLEGGVIALHVRL